MQKYFNNYAGATGIAIKGAEVIVTKADGSPAAIFSDNGVTPITTLLTGADGEFAFYAANDTYTITLRKRGLKDEVVAGVQLYDPMDDGAATLGFQPAGAAAVPRTVQEKLRESVSVKDFGAVGDGIADDAEAIQAACNYNPSGAVIFPPGVYIVSQMISVPPSVVLIGSGKAATVKQGNGANLDAIFRSGVSGSTNTSLRVFNLRIDGNRSNQTNGAGHGFHLLRAIYAWFDLCEVVNCRGDGIRVETEANNFENYVRNCRVFGSGGRNVAFVGLGTDCHVRGGNYGYSVGSSIFLSTASSSINDSTIWGGNLSAYGIELYGVSCQIRNNEIEGCTKDGVLISSFARHTFVEGNKLYANSFSSANSGLYGGCAVEAGAGPGTFVANRVYAALSGGAAAYNQGYALKFSGAHDTWEIAANSMIWTGASANGTESTTAVVVGLLATDKTDAIWSKSRISVGLAANLSAPGLNNWLPLPLSNEVEDGWGEWDTATYTFTPKESGRYQFSGIMTCDPDGIGSKMNFRIFRTSGTAAEIARFGGATASDGEVMPVPMRTIEAFLAAGSSYRIEFFLTGASTTVLAGSVFTQVQIKRVPQ